MTDRRWEASRINADLPVLGALRSWLPTLRSSYTITTCTAG